MRILSLLDCKDLYNSDISLNERLVHIKDYNTIQVEKQLLNRYQNNKLFLMVKLAPTKLVSSLPANEQYIDLPISLINCLILGLGMYSHTIGVISQETGAYSSGINPFKQRYDEAVSEAIKNGYVYPQGINYVDIQKLGFI